MPVVAKTAFKPVPEIIVIPEKIISPIPIFGECENQILQYPGRFIETPAIGDMLLCGYIPDEKTDDITQIRISPLEKTGIGGK
ncbi:MAG: hypothetical protein LUQ35_03015 [Methanoregula sp.]|nr:hypothetical protein [Methanoregula sp.]